MLCKLISTKYQIGLSKLLGHELKDFEAGKLKVKLLVHDQSEGDAWEPGIRKIHLIPPSCGDALSDLVN